MKYFYWHSFNIFRIQCLMQSLEITEDCKSVSKTQKCTKESRKDKRKTRQYMCIYIYHIYIYTCTYIRAYHNSQFFYSTALMAYNLYISFYIAPSIHIYVHVYIYRCSIYSTIWFMTSVNSFSTQNISSTKFQNKGLL